jgi:3-oxoacyl-[acyl-carrier-protein] synthase II
VVRPGYLAEWAGEYGLKTSAVAEVGRFEAGRYLSEVEQRRTPRMVHLALGASVEAMEMAGVWVAEDDIAGQRQMGVALGTGGGGLAYVEAQYKMLHQGNRPSLFSITAGTHGNLSSELSIALRLRGPSHVMSTGCTSSTDALAYAAGLVKSGRVKRMLAGGADAPIAPGILSAFEKMRVVSTRYWEDARRASRPFQKDRDGFVLGEGAWMFVIETLEGALARGAKPLAEIAGYGSTCDAFHRVQIRPDVIEPVRAISEALADAGETTASVDYINLHGTSTDLNDRLETAAIRAAFGGRAGQIAASSTKSMIGHPQGACGAAGIAATVLGMQAGAVHPTINQENADDACDLDYVANVGRKMDVRVALCNCIAFGSKNSAIVIRRV